MKLMKIAGLSLTAAATFAIGASPALARPHHDRRPHKVCKVERHHGHRTTVCHWVR